MSGKFSFWLGNLKIHCQLLILWWLQCHICFAINLYLFKCNENIPENKKNDQGSKLARIVQYSRSGSKISMIRVYLKIKYILLHKIIVCIVNLTEKQSHLRTSLHVWWLPSWKWLVQGLAEIVKHFSQVSYPTASTRNGIGSYKFERYTALLTVLLSKLWTFTNTHTNTYINACTIMTHTHTSISYTFLGWCNLHRTVGCLPIPLHDGITCMCDGISSSSGKGH